MRACGRGIGIRLAGVTVVIVLGVGFSVAGTGLTAGAAPVSPAAPGGPTTTTVAPTTTAPPVTTTSEPATTTTAPPASTSSTHPARTTTTATTPSTTTPHAASTSSNTPWALIAVIVVLVVAIALVALLIRSRKKKGVEAEWHRAVVPALSDAQLARDAVLSDNAMAADPTLRGAVEVQVEKAAVALDRVARAAPDPQAGGLATEAAGSLRGLAFAVEADRLLHQGASAPTGVQLAEADEARRARNSELSGALSRLSTRIGAPPRSRPAR
jgi:hypothetical protein